MKSIITRAVVLAALLTPAVGFAGLCRTTGDGSR
jgi:hypothetical protein